ncbi:hypothetical protein [Pseudobacteriovorax antillogorgiicola]|uniref:Uncharacterized protein n=1 Tax=Pseudobacteriovorax antillogorgiicola TaxID=1513793 RepID=A0A1Y6BF85_9BACT|nr:hypothetical protein [Pseudobacteriovorax antillogorgiicola]TCS56502.1 hypothetical protein EDD56_104324 [Pseudobacteriovorax antillogorgiicola]SMF04663.1 hypothetical protein SAMN06296036_1049 [Pseudobacteriovorax antillogorgiicola]
MRSLAIGILFGLTALSANAASLRPIVVTSGDFKMYEEPFQQPNVGCDLFEALSIKAFDKNTFGLAKLERTLDGYCKIGYNPNPRSYFLTAKPAGCGSVKYEGIRKNSETGELDTVDIIDHRGRLCKDLVPAKIIVKESLAGQGYKWFSYSPIRK